MKTVIVIPTYNEKGNIVRIINALMEEFKTLEQDHIFSMNILVVDDNSPDGSGKIVENICKYNKKVGLITGKKQGLGKAYIRGFSYAINIMHADIVMQMDADFSHDPKDVSRLLQPMYEQNMDLVIGSRYIPGGSIPSDWGIRRKLNSQCANILARYISGLYTIHDCTAGFRAIRISILKKISFEHLKVKGYCFQMNLLHAVVRQKGKVMEVPVHFIDRTIGTSKIRLSDILEFIGNAFILRGKQMIHDLRAFYFFLSDSLENLLPEILQGGGLFRRFSK